MCENVDHQNVLSIIGNESSVINCRSTIICYWFSIIGNSYQLSVKLLSDSDRPPSEFRPLPSDFNTFPLSDLDKIWYVDLF